MKVDILVLNYNGKDLMEKFMPSICAAAGNSSHECRVHVVDNLSVDDSVDFLRRDFPDVEVRVARENRILCSYNDVLKDLDSDIVILLNNDMEVAPDFVDPLVKHFEKKDVMFVAPRVMNPDNTFNGGRSYLKFKKGIIKVIVDADNFMEPGQTCAIAAGAFRRDVFLSLGGYDDLYMPGIWEDVDICFRGLTRGWKGIYEPQSVTWHAESTTFHREYGKKRKMVIAHRNMFLFFWKNITDRGLFARHLLLIVPRVVAQALTGRMEMLEGLVKAIPRIPLVIERRRRLKEDASGRVIRERDLMR